MMTAIAFLELSIIHRYVQYAPHYADPISFIEVSILQAQSLAFLFVTNSQIADVHGKVVEKLLA